MPQVFTCSYKCKSNSLVVIIEIHFTHTQVGVCFPGEGILSACPVCGILVPSIADHQGSLLCQKAKECADKKLQVDANCCADLVVFCIGNKPIKRVSHFKYLGCTLAENDDDLPAVLANVCKAC